MTPCCTTPRFDVRIRSAASGSSCSSRRRATCECTSCRKWCTTPTTRSTPACSWVAAGGACVGEQGGAGGLAWGWGRRGGGGPGEAMVAGAGEVVGERGPKGVTLGGVGQRGAGSPAALLYLFGPRRDLLLAVLEE